MNIFRKKKIFSSKLKRSKVTDYAALNACDYFENSEDELNFRLKSSKYREVDIRIYTPPPPPPPPPKKKKKKKKKKIIIIVFFSLSNINFVCVKKTSLFLLPTQKDRCFIDSIYRPYSLNPLCLKFISNK